MEKSQSEGGAWYLYDVQALWKEIVELQKSVIMAFKKTDNCCRYCRWRGWGKTYPKQTYDDKMVCLRKPKTFKKADPNERYYFATVPEGGCENYERRTEQ